MIRSNRASSATRFVQTYGLTQVDLEFDRLFAETVDIWHSFDHETMSLPGDEFAGAKLRMLRVTAEIVRRGHSDWARWTREVSTSLV